MHPDLRRGSFGDLSPLLAPRSVAIVGASDRDGNLGGQAVGFLNKFGFDGPVWPVNSGRSTVGGLPCFASLADLPSVPDLAILAVPADSVVAVLRDCVAAGVPAAVAWAGGFAEAGEEGKARQLELQAVCRDSGIKFCGPNCIGIINTGIGLTASFSSMLVDHDRLAPGAVSMVSQSGGICVMAHSRAQEFGLGFRVTISCGNEASLGIPDFIHALAQDDGTRVIAVYTEGLSDPAAFVRALAEARRRGKPVVVLKGGATEASGRAALAHTGRLAGMDRTYDAIFREFAAIRVYSTEELLDVCLQLASLQATQLPRGDRVLISSFGGGGGVICTDQCGREGLSVPRMDDATIRKVMPQLTPLSSALNPVDMTPGAISVARHRATLPDAFATLSHAPGLDSWLFLASGLGSLAPSLLEMYDAVRKCSDKPVLLAWQAMPKGIPEELAARGIYPFGETARAARTLAHLTRHAADLGHRIRQVPVAGKPFPWREHVAPGASVVSENVVAAMLEAADLPVARGRIALDADEAMRFAQDVGFPVAMKGISPAITHRAAAGLVVLGVDSQEAVGKTDQALRQRARELGAELDGIWVQHMVQGDHELIVTAFRDAEFGVMLGVGMGGGQTEIIDDVVLARVPLAVDGALDLLDRLRTVRRLPTLFTATHKHAAAKFVAAFSQFVATAPWTHFTFEINPVKLDGDKAVAVDGLLLIDEPSPRLS